MGQDRAEPRAAARSAWLCAAALGCGDIGDAQLPLPVYGSRSRELPAELELTPAPFAVVPAQAAASVVVSPTAGADCAIEFETTLPDASSSHTFITGSGARAIDGEGATVACHVLEALDSPGVFDVTVSLRHPRLPWFRASGRLEAGASALDPSEASATGMFWVRITTPDAAEVSAACSVEADEVVRGAVWFHSLACPMPSSEPHAGGCEVAIQAIFERCGQ